MSEPVVDGEIFVLTALLFHSEPGAWRLVPPDGLWAFLPLLAVTLLSARSELITVPSDGADASSPAAVNLTVLPGAGGTDTAFNHTAVADGYLSIVSNGAPHFKAPPPAGGGAPAAWRLLSPREEVVSRALGLHLHTHRHTQTHIHT